MYKIFKHRKHPCIPCFGGNAYYVAMIQYFSFTFFLFFVCNATFFHSGYVSKPLQPSSAIYGAPPFTGNPVESRVLLGFFRQAWYIFSKVIWQLIK